jgi:hypothetical protein
LGGAVVTRGVAATGGADRFGAADTFAGAAGAFAVTGVVGGGADVASDAGVR